jgi:GTPase SAR1 family protein
VRNEFYKEASMILLVFDLTLKRSLEGLDMWMREANDYGAGALPVFVAANKVNQSYTLERLD